MFIHYGSMEPKKGYYSVAEYKAIYSNTDCKDSDIQEQITYHCPPKRIKGVYAFPMFRYSIDWVYIYKYLDNSKIEINKDKIKRGEYINEYYHEIKEEQIKAIYSKIEKDGTVNNIWKEYNILDYLEALFNRIDMHIAEYVKDIDDYIEKINVCKNCNDAYALEVFIELKGDDKE
jgi:hypothetical protein